MRQGKPAEFRASSKPKFKQKMIELSYGCLLIFFVIILFISIKLHLSRMKIDNLHERTVFITGCDSGFGQSLALKLLENRITTFAGCLTSNGCERMLKMARFLPGKLFTVQVDVRSDESLEKAKSFIKEHLDEKELWGVVCNAGVSYGVGPDDFLTVDNYIATFDVNTFGVIRTCHTFKPLLKKSNGRLVIMSSMLGRLTLPQLCPYVATKFAVEGYANTLRLESFPFGYSVHLIEPGFFQTEMTNVESAVKQFEMLWKNAPEETKQEYGENFLHEQSSATKSGLATWINQDVTPVIDAYFHALTSRFPSYRYVVGVDAKFILGPLTFLPWPFFELAIRCMQYLHGMPTPVAGRKSRKDCTRK